MRLPSAEWYSRFRPDTTPADADGPMPNGKPTATTSSPIAQIRGRAQRRRDQVVRDGLRLQHGEVVLGPHADDRRVGLHAVEEAHLDPLGADDDVQVGEDDALVDDHDAGAHAGAAVRALLAVLALVRPTCPPIAVSADFSFCLRDPSAGLSLPPSLRNTRSRLFASSLAFSRAAGSPLPASAPLPLPPAFSLSWSPGSVSSSSPGGTQADHAHDGRLDRRERLGRERRQAVVLERVQDRGVDVLLREFLRAGARLRVRHHERDREERAAHDEQRPFEPRVEPAHAARAPWGAGTRRGRRARPAGSVPAPSASPAPAFRDRLELL